MATATSAFGRSACALLCGIALLGLWSAPVDATGGLSGSDGRSIAKNGTHELRGVVYPPLGQTSESLIVHWDGTSWERVSSPSPGAQMNILRSVSARSADDVWAVGEYSNKLDTKGTKLLYLHWNGTRWKQVAGP